MAMSLCYCPSSITSILTNNNNKTTLISPTFNFNFPVSSIRQTSSLSLSSSSSIVVPKVSEIETASVEKEEGEAVEFEAADASKNGEEAKGEEVFAVVM
ncbi:hypothetical protein Tco_0084475, partial [Tanacetum coccineum]